MRPTLRTAVLSSLLLAWLVLAASLFVSVSRSDFVHLFTLPGLGAFEELAGRIPIATYVPDLLGALAGALAFSAGCLSLGLAVQRNWQRSDANYLAVGATAFLTGEIVLSIVFLTAIVLYRLTPPMVAGVLALSLLVGLRSTAAYLAGRPGRLSRDFTRSDVLLLALVVLALVLAVTLASARLSYEAAAENFTQAKTMAVAQSAVYTYPNDPFLVSSFHPGILYTALIQLFGDVSARMLTWVNGLAILLLGIGIGKEAGITSRARLWFLALMVTSTAFLDLLGDGKVEIISTAPLLAAVYWMLRGLRAPTDGTFALIGFLLGFSMIARPYNIFLAPLFVVAFYTIHMVTRARQGGFDFRSFFLAAMWMLPSLWAMGTFHLLQNWLWLGNPIAPLVEGRHLSADAWQWQFDPQLLRFYRLLYPLAVTFTNSPQSLGSITPLFAGALPLLALRRVREGLRYRPIIRDLGLAAAITLALWVAIFYTVVEIRYALFIWILLFLVVAQVLDDAASVMARHTRFVFSAVTMLLVAFMGLRSVLVGIGTYSPVDSSGQAHCYDNAFCTFLEPLNRQAQPGQRVFVLNAYRYYLRPDLLACSSRAQEYPQLENLAQQGSPDFWVELYRRGFMYLTYETNYATVHTQFGHLPGTGGLPAWLHVTQLSSSPSGGERVYRIEGLGAPAQPDVYCEKESTGIWELRILSPQD